MLERKECFICNEIKTVNNDGHNDGGLARITREVDADKNKNGKIASFRFLKDLIFY